MGNDLGKFLKDLPGYPWVALIFGFAGAALMLPIKKIWTDIIVDWVKAKFSRWWPGEVQESASGEDVQREQDVALSGEPGISNAATAHPGSNARDRGRPKIEGQPSKSGGRPGSRLNFLNTFETDNFVADADKVLIEDGSSPGEDNESSSDRDPSPAGENSKKSRASGEIERDNSTTFHGPFKAGNFVYGSKDVKIKRKGKRKRKYTKKNNERNITEEQQVQTVSGVPVLKATREIFTDKISIFVGDCKLNFPKHSVREPARLEVMYNFFPIAPPKGHVHAGSTLSCVPPYKGQKNVGIILPTWCSTKSQINIGIFFRTREDNWKKLPGEMPLTHEGHLELHYRFIDNLTAFVSQDGLPDIMFKISCFLFNNADGKFVMGFILSDRAREDEFLCRMNKEGYFPSIKSSETFTAAFEDKIAFGIKPGMTREYFIVDKQFVASLQGHIFYTEIDVRHVNLAYEITQKRAHQESGDGVEEVIYEKLYKVQ